MQIYLLRQVKDSTKITAHKNFMNRILELIVPTSTNELKLRKLTVNR